MANQSAHVRIRKAAIPAYAASIPIDRRVQMDPHIHYLGHGAATVNFFFCLDSINFGSGYFPFILDDTKKSGFRAIAARLTEGFHNSGSLPPDVLRSLTAEDCAAIFSFDLTCPSVRELMELFSSSLNEVGQFVCDNYSGNFMAIIEEAGGSAQHLVEIMTRMRTFQDVAIYRGASVPFYKRAQLLIADLFIAFSGDEPGFFHDIDAITICADNLVPHVLRLDGVLSYSNELLRRIEEGDLIPAGSQEEVELRACAVHAGELLVDELRKREPTMNGLYLDNYLWHRGQNPFYRERRRHLTRTIYY